MIRSLNRLLNIRSAEWRRVSLLFLMIAVSNAGALWGTTIAYAAFLQQAGLEVLPWVLVGSSVLSILAIAIYAAFVDRVANDRLFVAILVSGTVSILLGLVLLGLNRTSLAYLVLYLLFLALLAVFNPHFTTYVNGFYDIQSAKRVLPVVSAGARMGAIVAGLTMPLLTARFTPSGIIVIWLLTHVASMGLVWIMPSLLREERAPSDQPDHTSPAAEAGPRKQRPSYLDSMREGFRYTTQSTYLRWVATGTLLLMILLALIEYRSSELLLEIYGTPENLANFLALLAGVGNLVALPMLLFGTSRLIARVGLGNASLVFPAGNLLVCGGLVLAGGPVSASAAYLDRTTFRITFQYPIDGLLYNAVPLRVKGRARAFVGGLIVPVGTLIGGLLLVLPWVSTRWWIVPILVSVLAVAYTATAMVVRRIYSQALVKLLEQEDYTFLLSQEASELTIADPATLAQLQKKLLASTSHELTIFMAQLISQIGGSQAASILGQAVRAAEDARSRSALIDVLVAADLHSNEVRQLYTEFLNDPDGAVRESAVAGLEQMMDPTDGQVLSRILDIVQDPDPGVRARVLSALARSGDFYQLTPAVQALDQLLVDHDPDRRAHGIRVLGEIGTHRAIRNLIEFLTDPADEVRLEAALAVEAWSRSALPALKAVGSNIDGLVVEKMSPLLQDPIERARQAALVVLGRIGTRESHQAMVDSLADSSPQVRATAVDALVRVGKAIIPIAHTKLNAPNPHLRKMAAVTLSRINPREYGTLIVGSNITGNLLTIYRNYGLAEALARCTQYPSIVVLQSALREQNQQLLDEIFYLLAAVHDPSDVEIISESLRSESARVRANAAEALEALTTPHTAGLIAPLFDPESPPAQLLSLSEDNWDMKPPDTAQAIHQLATNPDDPWLRAITAFALGEIGAVLSPKEEQQLPAMGAIGKSSESFSKEPMVPRPAAADVDEEAKGRRTRRSPPADLLGALIDDAAPEGTDEQPDVLRTTAGPDREAGPQQEAGRPKERKARRSPPADLLGVLVETSRLEEEVPSQPHDGPALSPKGVLRSEAEETEGTDQPSPPALPQSGLTFPEIEVMLEASLADPADEVRVAAQAARRAMAAARPSWPAPAQEGRASPRMGSAPQKEEAVLLSTIERIIFLKEVPFFQGMTIDQLKVLATVCEEEFFEEDTRIFDEGDPGGALYVVVSGRVGIEREKRKGYSVRVATVEAHSYFGEITLFDSSPRTASAIAIQDTLMLRLRREPLTALARQYPDMSLELINVLSKRLKESNDRIAELSRTRPRQLQKLFDELD